MYFPAGLSGCEGLIMTPQPQGHGFEATRWTLLGDLMEGGDAERRAMEAICSIYRPPVLAWFLKSGCKRDHADDHTQSFFVEVVFGRRLLHGADRTKGTLRSLITRALKHFKIDKARRAIVQNKHVRASTNAELDRAEQSIAESNARTPEEAMDKEWALTLLHRAIVHCERECRSNGITRNWIVFEKRVLHPLLHHCEPVPLEALAQEHDWKHTRDVPAAVQGVKHKLDAMLKLEIAAGGGTSTEQQEELTYLRDLLGSARVDS